jgi:hypothetical protein
MLPPIIEPASAALVLADPYWPDWQEYAPWVTDFAERVLIPNGSLLCWIGGANYREIINTIAARLEYVWPLTMLHDNQGLHRGIFVRQGGCAVAWFMKAPAQRRSFPATENGATKLITPIVQSVIKGARDKELHPWQQGDAVWQWIEPLTAPGELIVDPFAGSGEWGRIAGQMGRQYVGCDLVEGGSTECADRRRKAA